LVLLSPPHTFPQGGTIFTAPHNPGWRDFYCVPLWGKLRKAVKGVVAVVKGVHGKAIPLSHKRIIFSTKIVKKNLDISGYINIILLKLIYHAWKE